MYSEQWITRDGTRLHVFEMKTDHLINCVNKIRRDNWRTRWLPRLEEELRNRRR